MTGSGFVGVHMGAGYHSPINWETYNAVCRSACKKAIEVLKSTNSALKAVVAATVYLENSQWSNAGFGSNLTLTGKVECDASIMDGDTLLFGSAGAVSGVKNPIMLADNILSHQMRGEMSLGRIPPCMLVSEGAKRWAVSNGVEVVDDESLISENARKSYIKNKRKLEHHDSVCEFESMPSKKSKMESEEVFDYDRHAVGNVGLCEVEISDEGQSLAEQKLDTIGVVCVDGSGRVASTVSSGGIILKQPGRVGQAGLYGCGCWAENEANGGGVAATTSGSGEHLMKTLLAKECAETLKNCEEPVQSLMACFQSKFLGSPFLRGVREPMGGALTLKTSINDEEKLVVEFQWIHTTESLSFGFMSTEDAQPQAFVSALPKERVFDKTVTAGNHCCTIPIFRASNSIES